MRPFDIYIDSCGEMPAEMRKEHNILFIPMLLNIDNKGEIDEFPALIDYDGKYDFKAFYDVLRKGIRMRTAAIPQVTFEECFRESAAKGHDVLYLACSSGLSLSVNLADKIGKKMMEDDKDLTIYALDTLISGFPIADMAIIADNMRKEGKGVKEVAEFLEARKMKYNQFATVETLTYLKNAGRVSASSAFFGNLFGVKPIIISDVKGHNVAVEKVKGRKAALERCIDLAIEAAEDIEHQTVYISHADDEAALNFLKENLLSKAKPGKVVTGKIGPIIGASSGPGVVCVYVFGKEVTYCGE